MPTIMSTECTDNTTREREEPPPESQSGAPPSSVDEAERMMHKIQMTNFPSRMALKKALLQLDHPKQIRRGLFTLRNCNIPATPGGVSVGLSDTVSAVVTGGAGAAKGVRAGDPKPANLHILANSLVAACHIGGVFLPADEEAFWGVRLAPTRENGQPMGDTDINLLMWRAWKVLLIDDVARKAMILETLAIMSRENLAIECNEDTHVDCITHGATIAMLTRILLHHIGGEVMINTLGKIKPVKKERNGLTKHEVAELIAYIDIHTMERPLWVN